LVVIRSQSCRHFRYKKFTYQNIPLPKDTNLIFSGQHFFETLKGELLLIRHSRSVVKYDEAKQVFVEADNALPVPKDWHPNNICWDDHQKTYWASCDSGLVQINPATNHVNYRGHNIDNDPVITAFQNQKAPAGAQVDADGNIFFFYWYPTDVYPILSRYNRKTNAVETSNLYYTLNQYHEIMNYLIQRNGRIWFYGMPFFAQWERNTNTFIPLNNQTSADGSLNFDHVIHAYEDRENNIWMATDNGVYSFNPDDQIFNTYDLIRSKEKKPINAGVNAVAELDNKIIAGCWGVGLFFYDKNFNLTEVPPALNERHWYMSVWDMVVHSRSNYLWIAEQGGTLDVYDPKKDKLITMQPEIFQLSTIRQVDEDTSGNLWFGTQNGRLIKWDYKKSGGDPTKGYEFVYQTGRILKVHYDYQGFVWVGTLARGLLKFNAKTNQLVKTFTDQGNEGERLFNNSPGDMSYYNDSTLLVTAGCLNIINTKTNKISFFSTDEGLPSNTAESIQKDNNGIVWIGMTNGLCRLNLEKKVISYYDKRDGINHDRFATTGVEHLSNGDIVLFTDHNFMVFDPKNFGQKNIPPRPYITSFKLSEQLLSLDSMWKEKRVVLSYDNTSITIGFSALSYLQQRKVHYFYRMEGLDKDWIHVDRPMEAVYNSLPPGDYIFKVKSENADGMTSAVIASIPITVRPPFWETWWFYSLIALTVIAILYLIDKERVKRRNSLRDMRREIRANLKDEISTTLNNINVLSEIAKIKADKNVEQAKDFIDQISDKSRYMNEVLDDTIWSIDPTNDSMKKFVLRIKELTEGLQTSYNVTIDLIVDNKVQALELDMKLRYELLFFYKEALNFIIENTQCKQVFVNINKTRSKLYMEILSESGQSGKDVKTKFEKTIHRRVVALAATLDVLADHKSFSSVLYIDVK
jgi:Y_Y_Y domain